MKKVYIFVMMLVILSSVNVFSAPTTICKAHRDCDDGDTDTRDICKNPSTIQSFCVNEERPGLLVLREILAKLTELVNKEIVVELPEKTCKSETMIRIVKLNDNEITHTGNGNLFVLPNDEIQFDDVEVKKAILTSTCVVSAFGGGGKCLVNINGNNCLEIPEPSSSIQQYDLSCTDEFEEGINLFKMDFRSSNGDIHEISNNNNPKELYLELEVTPANC